MPPNILLGEVSEIVGKTAKIKLYSTPGENIEAHLANSGTPVTLIGRGGGNFKFELPREAAVSLDEPVSVAPDFLVGMVKKIDADPREPLQTIYLASPVNIFSLQYILILQ